ncbi:MAG: hypothetical protein IKU36_09275 [Bacteroidales bacterium]|nr:hypothetical protein [Bacteroidales bacterium]
MRGKITLVLMAVIMMSCSKEGFRTDRGLDYTYGRDIPHDKIVLGDRLQNPYTTENMTKALQSLYPTRADRVDVKTTNLYVRFLPTDKEQYDKLRSLGLDMMDHPMDYDIIVDGDWYHDPDVPEGDVTWQYAVVPRDFTFPDIRYEILDECYIAENDPGTRSDGIDWEAVERESYVLTGNGSRLASPGTRASGKMTPSGRITIEDEKYKGGQPFGVSGVRVSCNSFVKTAHAYTDRDGYYQMDKSFASDIRYRLVFKNEKSFSIGFNLVLVPASVSTLGKSSPEGVSMTVTKDSDEKLYRRCVVNNAAYDYISRCGAEDMGISAPPSDLRIWIFGGMESSSAVMFHHGALLSYDLIQACLGKYYPLVEMFLPDITIGTKGDETYDTIYSTTCHELAHASHFSKVGISYWNSYILYIMESFIDSGGMTYGDGSGRNAGYCEIGEMWAYYLESKMYKERYGGSFPTFGTNYWFYPQIFRFLDDRGLTRSKIFSVLDKDVTTREELEASLTLSFPENREIIQQVFSRY